jgi:hypothetical protein
VVEQQGDALHGQLVRAQPAGQLLHQALGALQALLGVLDAIEQFDLRVKNGRRFDPFEQLGRHAVGGVEHVEQRAAAAALQAGARQAPHGADVEAADAFEPGWQRAAPAAAACSAGGRGGA